MFHALCPARPGINGQQTQLNISANILANLKTGGFNKSRPQFADIIYQTLRAVGTETVADGIGSLVQNFFKTSNVDVSKEMINLAISQSAHEVNSKAITTAGQLMEIANSSEQ